MIIEPGHISLADWREIYEGASAELSDGAWDAIDASAAAVARIVAKGAPVYASTPASESWRACASRATIWRRSSAISC